MTHSLLGKEIIFAPTCFHPKIQLGRSAPVSDECRINFNQWLVDMFGMRDASLVRRGTSLVVGNKIIIRAEDEKHWRALSKL